MARRLPGEHCIHHHACGVCLPSCGAPVADVTGATPSLRGSQIAHTQRDMVEPGPPLVEDAGLSLSCVMCMPGAHQGVQGVEGAAATRLGVRDPCERIPGQMWVNSCSRHGGVPSRELSPRMIRR